MKRILMLLGLSILLGDAVAGPLLERLRERREAREPATAEWGEEADAVSAGGLPTGTRVLRDLAYGTDAKQRLDVYLPPKVAQGLGKLPVIFMVHGGAWRVGDKAMSRVVDNKLARWSPRGVVFVSVNYRMLPGADPREQAEDVARALGFAQNKAADWGADPAGFVLMGHSAGAHLVSLLNSAPQRAFALGARPWLGTVSLDSAAMDVPAIMQTRHYRFYDKAFGTDPAFWQETSPLQQLSSGAPPLFAVCSSQRPDKPCPATQRYAEAARRLGGRVEVLEQAASHSALNEDLGKPGAYTEAVEHFMASLSPALAAHLNGN